MGHKHWPKNHPLYAVAPVHDLPKKDCDILWREYMHGHEGQRCVMELKPGNKTETCSLRGEAKTDQRAVEKERQRLNAEAFINSEKRRIATLLEGVR